MVLKLVAETPGFDDKVVVLSSSNLPGDMQKARALGAHDYRVKPADIDDMITMVKDVANRWLTRQP
jgi:DNA-binding NarL/FixJ family response regulator